MLPVNCGSHSDYQNFLVKNLLKYYPNPDAIARSTWDIIERFWILDLSYTDELMRDKYSKFGPAPRTPSCMQRSYFLSIDFKVTSFSPKEQPYHSLLQIYKKKFLDTSVSKGLITKETLALAGDGTPVVTSHRMRSHRICDIRLIHAGCIRFGK